jgi:hypothetical protein
MPPLTRLIFEPTRAIAQTSVPAQAQTLSAEDLARRTLERCPVEVAIWGMPIVAFDAMRQAFLRDAGRAAFLTGQYPRIRLLRRTLGVFVGPFNLKGIV